MPAKTPAKKAPAAKKPAAKRPAAPQKPAAAKPPARPPAAPPPDRSGEIAALQATLREREGALRAAQEKISALEKRPAPSAPPPQADPQQAQQLRELQARLTTREAELQAARTEATNLRDSMKRMQGPGEQGELRCPRCGGHMTEYQEGPIKADRCDGCFGIFFDNGEMEAVLGHHDQQRDAGKKGWFASLLGKK